MASDENMAFEIVRGQPVPIFPVPGREVNGVTIISLLNCVAAFGGTIDERREQWLAAWGRYVTDDVAAAAPEDRDSAVASMVGWDAIRLARFQHITNDRHWDFVKQFCRERKISPTEIGVRIDSDPETDKDVVHVIATIAAIRRMADRSGLRAGESEPEFCGADGVWKPAPWLDDNIPPKAARVTVWRKDTDRPFSGIAEWKRCVQLTRGPNDGVVLTEAWEKGGPFQLGRCASAAAHRYAFPEAVGQTYTDDEMDPKAKPASIAEVKAVAARASSVESMPSVNLNTGEVREVKEQPTFSDDPMRAKSLVDDSTPPMSRLPLELILRDVADNADAAKDLIQNKFRVWWPKLYAWADPRVFVAVVLRHVDLMKASV